MALIEVGDDEKIVSKEQLEQLFKQQDEDRETIRKQKVLISHSAKVVQSVTGLFPGLEKGNFMAGINPLALMSDPRIKDLAPQVQKLKQLMDEYTKTNPIVL